MPRGRALPPEVWAEIKHRYERGEPIPEILKLYGIAESTFHWHRQAGEWERKDTNAALKAVATAAKEPTPENIDQAVTALEQRMAVHVQASKSTGTAPPARITPEARRTMALVGTMADRVQRLLQSPQLLDEAVELRDRTKALLDLTNALERLQKIERTALGLDAPQALRDAVAGAVVIVVPAKQSEAEWTRKTLQEHAIDAEEAE